MLGQPLVIADAASVFHDPSERPLDDPAAGQHLEGVQVVRALNDLQGAVQRASRPGEQLAGVPAVGPDQGDGAVAGGQPPQQRAGAIAVATEAAVTTTHKIRPITSTAICLLRPSIFLPAS